MASRMTTRASSARDKRQAWRESRLPPKRICPRSTSRNTPAVSPAVSPGATAVFHATGLGDMATTTVQWADDEICTFGGRRQKNINEIEEKGLKTAFQVQECHNVLARAGLLYDRLDAHHIQSASKVLSEYYKVTIRSPPRTLEEEKIWDWRHKLRKAFFDRKSSSIFAPKALPDAEVAEIRQLFFQMDCAAVNPSLIKENPKRDDEFGGKAEVLCAKWETI
ncbi:hypothetical protein B0H14DRAFT_2572466 [Mycena olivaceomarginata]|nr:hypothetical protein B0H14DRAFT_2572466 [Mycena olivaceomarginata]